MTVSNNQLANQTTYNNAFMSRTANDNTTGIKSLENADAVSGDFATNPQRDINSLSSYSGRTANSAKDALPTWSSTDAGSGTDDLTERAEALTAKFNATSGHDHSGSAGSGGPISASDLDDINYYRADWQTTSLSSTAATSTDVSAAFSGKTSGGGVSTVGVLTDVSNNRIVIVNATTETAIEDAEGQRVYGRLTYSTGVWTLSYYTNEAGAETAFTMTVQTIRIYFREVFTLATFPTIPADLGQIPSLDLTADIVDAGPNQRGLTRFAAGSSSLGSGVQSVSVTFSTAFPDTNYAIAHSFLNTTDALLTFLQGIITAKSTSGFTMTFNAPTDTANYVFEYTATRNA